MEFTPEAVRSAQFRIALRGYSTSEVDDFLAKLEEGVTELWTKVQALTERAERAERAALTPAMQEQGAAKAAAPDDDASMRRTLVLAQRAADLVVREAKSVADKLVADGESRAQSAISGAEAQAASILLSADARASEALATAHAKAATEVAAAEAQSRTTIATAESQAAMSIETAEIRAGEIDSAARARASVLVAEAQTRAEELVVKADAKASGALTRAEQVEAEAVTRHREVLEEARRTADAQLDEARGRAAQVEWEADAEIGRRWAAVETQATEARALATGALEAEVTRLRGEAEVLAVDSQEAASRLQFLRVAVDELEQRRRELEIWVSERRQAQRARLHQELALLDARDETEGAGAPPRGASSLNVGAAPDVQPLGAAPDLAVESVEMYDSTLMVEAPAPVEAAVAELPDESSETFWRPPDGLLLDAATFGVGQIPQAARDASGAAQQRSLVELGYAPSSDAPTLEYPGDEASEQFGAGTATTLDEPVMGDTADLVRDPELGFRQDVFEARDAAAEPQAPWLESDTATASTFAEGDEDEADGHEEAEQEEAEQDEADRDEAEHEGDEGDYGDGDEEGDDGLPIHVVLRARDEAELGFTPPWDLGGRAAAKAGPATDGSLAARLRRAHRD